MAKCLHHLFWLLTVIQPLCCCDNLSLFLKSVFNRSTQANLCLCVVTYHTFILRFHYVTVYLIYFTVLCLRHLAGGSRKQEFVEFLWMADFMVTSCELDSFTDC